MLEEKYPFGYIQTLHLCKQDLKNAEVIDPHSVSFSSFHVFPLHIVLKTIPLLMDSVFFSLCVWGGGGGYFSGSAVLEHVEGHAVFQSYWFEFWVCLVLVLEMRRGLL